MATRNLVPRNSGEGGVGRLDKAWATGVFDNLYFGGLMVSMDQNVQTSDNVEFLSGNFVSGLTLDGVNVSDLGSSIEQTLSGAAEFVFFHDVLDNNGVSNKTYFDTPTSNTHLSGVTVADASDLKITIRWDGPNDKYVGSAFINDTEIPKANISELGSNTRRFEGFIDNLNAAGLTQITGKANGRTSILILDELGLGPTPQNIFIDEVINSTPKAGEEKGSSHLKQGDSINVYADFDTNDVQTIKVFGSGISEEIGFTNYSLSGVDSIYRASIPITVSNQSGPQAVAVQAINAFGSTGEIKHSDSFLNGSGTRNLDQSYPNISTSDPSSYNGRNDGLRESESTSFSNSIANWTDGVDEIEYLALTSEINISNTTTFESSKTVSYANGIYNDSNNLRINATRLNNGATDTDLVKIKIANGPQITGSEMSSTASSANSPSIIGSSEVKAGDQIQSKILIDGKGTSINDVSVSVLNQGISNGSQTSYSSSYSKTTLADGSFEFLVPINVYGTLGNSSRDGSQAATFKVRNNFGTQSDSLTTSDTATVNNGTIPIISINSISYPGVQLAIKSSESAVIINTATNYDSITYSSPGSQLSISNTSTFEGNKTADYLAGGYNVSSDGGTNNFKISANKSSNGATVESYAIVNIANTPLALSINGLNSKLSSSPGGVSDSFSMSSSQVMLQNPTLSTDASQSNPSSLNQNSSGTGKSSNSFSITVTDSNTKGNFSWVVSARNLAGIDTTSIQTNPNYNIEGFSSRTVNSDPNSLGAGLSPIGTSAINTSNISFENLSEGGTAPNGGTSYTYKSFVNGTQLTNALDHNNQFTVCDSSGLTNTNGNHVFNLDKLNRSANTSVANPAQFIVEES